MKICLVQTKPARGVIAANIASHLKLVQRAVAKGADTILFPELSLTGYEPSLAQRLATTPDDNRFVPFQTLSNAHKVTIGVGVPLRQQQGITISLVFFHPHEKTTVYAKQYLHPDEEAFFIPGKNNSSFISTEPRIAPAICYELSVPAHAEQAVKTGAGFYLASVAKTATGVDKAAERLAQLAKTHAITTLLVNCVGNCEDGLCAGQSAVWNTRGERLAQLDESSEGLLLLDTTTGKAETVAC